MLLALIKLIILIQYSAVSMILFKYGETKNTKKLLYSLGTLSLIMYFTSMGIFFIDLWERDPKGCPDLLTVVHSLFSFISFVTFIIYIYKDKYYIWLLILPVLTCTFFLILDYFNLYHYFYLTN